MKLHSKSTDSEFSLALVGGAFAASMALLIVASGAVGYVNNIITIAHSDFHSINGELVLRVVGAFVPPVGAVMGWLP